MDKPNIFKYATKELSQDAFIFWLLDHANPKYMHVNQDLKNCALSLISEFFKLENKEMPEKFENFSLSKQYKNIDSHFHFSIQSGDNLILKRMGRRHSREDVIALCLKIKEIRPDAVFSAYFICGFPTETINAFENTCKLVTEAGLHKLHVFPYSEREGTPAARMPQLPMEERRRRAAILRDLSKE